MNREFRDRRRRGIGVGAMGRGITILLRDEFLTDVAAPLPSVRNSEPGPGQLKKSADSSNRVSIASGKLDWEGTAVSNFDNPGYAFTDNAGNGFPRAVGRVARVELEIKTSTSRPLVVGLSKSATVAVANTVLGLYFEAGAAARAFNASISGPTLFTWTVGVYTLWFVEFSAGGAILGKGGAIGSAIKLLWIDRNGTDAMLYPVGHGVSQMDWELDRVVLADRYMPVPLAYDTFSRANGALGSSEATGPDGQALSTLAWQFTSGIWTVSSNAAIATQSSGSNVITNGVFAADSDWTKGSGWAIGSGTANATASSADLTQTTPPLVVGTWYRVQYTISGYAAGSVRAVLGGVSLPAHAANGTFTEINRAGTTAFLMRGVGGFTGSIDNVSVSALPLADLFAIVQSSTPDVIADVGLTVASALGGKPAGLVLNLDSISNPQNFILCYHNGDGSIVLEECVNGVYGAPKFTTAVTYSAGAVLRVIRDGTSCRVFYNNAAVSTVQTMTANTNTLHGQFSTHSANSLDNFTIFPRGVMNEYVGLEAIN